MDLAALHFRCRRIALEDQDFLLLLKEEKKIRRRRRKEEQKMFCGVTQ